MFSKLTIAHLHVWDKKNKGDLAIVAAVQELIKKQLSDVKIIDFPVHLLKSSDPATLKAINQTDLAVIGGGGIFYHWFLPYDLKVIEAIKKPIFIYGVGYIREEGARRPTDKEKQSIKYLCNKAILIGVRDYYTKNFLTKLGLVDKKIKIIGDPAIFLSEKKTNAVDLSSKVKIGFNLNYSGWLGFGRYEDKILNSYNEVAKYFQKKFHAEIYYLVHHPSEAIIIKKLKIKKLKIVNLHPRQQKYLYSQLNLIIGMMLHSCVMSFGAGTPEINVAYDLRNRSFAKFINHSELVISPAKLNDNVLLEKAIDVFSKEAEYRQNFKKRKTAIWQTHSFFLQAIERLASQLLTQ